MFMPQAASVGLRSRSSRARIAGTPAESLVRFTPTGLSFRSEAIFAEDDVPDNQREYTALNAELAKVWKPIIEKKPAPPDADEWAKIKEKKHLLEK